MEKCLRKEVYKYQRNGKKITKVQEFKEKKKIIIGLDNNDKKYKERARKKRKQDKYRRRK